MLLINNLHLIRSNKIIFNNINIAASSGKIILIKGRNGSGKTTLIKTILNIIEPTNGEIFWLGKRTKTNIFKFYKDTTYIIDKSTSVNNLTVLENIYFWKNFSSSAVSHDSIYKLLEILELKEYLNKQVMYLSLGEIKKLELIRLIIEEKKLWIMDEPYNNLDTNSIEIFNQTFSDHLNKGGIILFSSHFQPNIIGLEVILVN